MTDALLVLLCLRFFVQLYQLSPYLGGESWQEVADPGDRVTHLALTH
jgi:hypothetical protein